MTAHALLSASGAKKWLACPPSVRVEEKLPEETSAYASEGTFAHEVGDLFLNSTLKKIPNAEYVYRKHALMKDPLWSQELADYVNAYVSVVLEKRNEAVTRAKDATVLIEQRLDFSPWVPNGFGTGDVVIISDGILEVIDLKYGKGVPVFADDNPQMMLYALGAYNRLQNIYDFDLIRMTIVQPRLDNISTAEITLQKLLDWGADITPIAYLALAGEGEFNAGDHCKFCRAKKTCRARADKNLELAKYEFRAGPLLEDHEIADILGKLDNFIDWAQGLKAFAHEQAVAHKKQWPGWKLVEGRSNRKITSETDAASALIAAGYDEAVLFEKSMLGITALEKLVGKKQLENVLEGLIIKPAGKPVLVPVGDRRPELNNIENDFKEEISNG
jgi:hypothetical protein